MKRLVSLKRLSQSEIVSGFEAWNRNWNSNFKLVKYLEKKGEKNGVPFTTEAHYRVLTHEKFFSQNMSARKGLDGIPVDVYHRIRGDFYDDSEEDFKARREAFRLTQKALKPVVDTSVKDADRLAKLQVELAAIQARMAVKSSGVSAPPSRRESPTRK